MPQAKSPMIAAAVDFLKGEDFVKGEQLVPEEIGSKHINELLHRHPFHPYNPEISKDPSHPCHVQNEEFLKCMRKYDGVDELTEEPMPLHMKHVNCYHPYKVSLMKCVTKMKRLQKKAEAEAAGSSK